MSEGSQLPIRGLGSPLSRPSFNVKLAFSGRDLRRTGPQFRNQPTENNITTKLRGRCPSCQGESCPKELIVLALRLKGHNYSCPSMPCLPPRLHVPQTSPSASALSAAPGPARHGPPTSTRQALSCSILHLLRHLAAREEPWPALGSVCGKSRH